MYQKKHATHFMIFKTCWSKTKGFFKKIFGGPWYKRILVWIATFIVATILFLLAVDNNFLNLFGKSPGFNDIVNPEVNEADLQFLVLVSQRVKARAREKGII